MIRVFQSNRVESNIQSTSKPPIYGKKKIVILDAMGTKRGVGEWKYSCEYQ